MMQNTPPGFPVNTLPIQRALVALSLSHPQKVESAIRLFWESFWVQWNDPTKMENMQAILRTALGSDKEAKEVIERTKTDEVKKALSANTSKAFEDGAFGLPWFVGECYLLCGLDDWAHVNCRLQLRMGRERRRDTGAWITWVSYVITWVSRDLVVRDGARCCKKKSRS